jgi:transcriptional regulator with AAA-type ATPase domain
LTTNARAKQGDGNRPQQYDWLGNIRGLQNVIDVPSFLLKSLRVPLQTDTKV